MCPVRQLLLPRGRLEFTVQFGMHGSIPDAGLSCPNGCWESCAVLVALAAQGLH